MNAHSINQIRLENVNSIGVMYIRHYKAMQLNGINSMLFGFTYTLHNNILI